MTAGTVLRCDVWHITENTDDNVGGAQITGTVAYSGVQCRREESMPSTLLLQQGLETEKVFTFTLKPSTLIIYERDEIEITWPPHDPYYGKKFRIMGWSYTNFHPSDPRGYLLVRAVRSVIGHTVQ